MKQVSQLDIGSVHVHKKVLADIIASAVEEVEGAGLIGKSFLESVLDLFGRKSFPGIEIQIDDNGDVSLEVRVCVRYGMNIPDVARQIQDVVRSSLDKTVDVNVKEINVSIQGIERGSK